MKKYKFNKFVYFIKLHIKFHFVFSFFFFLCGLDFDFAFQLWRRMNHFSFSWHEIFQRSSVGSFAGLKTSNDEDFRGLKKKKKEKGKKLWVKKCISANAESPLCDRRRISGKLNRTPVIPLLPLTRPPLF